MQVQTDIAFLHVARSDWADAQIRDNIAALAQIYARMTFCRVRVEQRADNSTHTVPPVVRIEIGIPGRKDIVVSHEPDRLQRKFQHPDLHNAITEAFRIAAAQLTEVKRKLADHKGAARHDGANEFSGQIAEIAEGEDSGFVMTGAGGLLYFHRSALIVGDFDKLRRGDEVAYVEGVGDAGPIALKVRVKDAL